MSSNAVCWYIIYNIYNFTLSTIFTLFTILHYLKYLQFRIMLYCSYSQGITYVYCIYLQRAYNIVPLSFVKNYTTISNLLLLANGYIQSYVCASYLHTYITLCRYYVCMYNVDKTCEYVPRKKVQIPCLFFKCCFSDAENYSWKKKNTAVLHLINVYIVKIQTFSSKL